MYLLEFVNRNIKDTNDWKLLLNDQNNNFGSVLTLASIMFVNTLIYFLCDLKKFRVINMIKIVGAANQLRLSELFTS